MSAGHLAIFTVFGSSSDIDSAAIARLVSYIVLPALTGDPSA